MPNDINLPPLKRALRAGAEIGLARAMADKGKPASVGEFIDKRLSDLSANDVGFLKKLASSILAAGDALMAAAPDEALDPDDIPTNGELFADEWEGKRVRWFGEWSIPGEDEWRKFSGTLPDISTPEEILSSAGELAFRFATGSPQLFDKAMQASQGEIKVRILGIEKAF